MPKLSSSPVLLNTSQQTASSVTLSLSDDGSAVLQTITHEGRTTNVELSPHEAVAYGVTLLKMAGVLEALAAQKAPPVK